MKENLLFIHIPKCGGTSVKEALNIRTGHQTIQSYKTALKPEEFEDKFSFSFVRNPFDRIASWHRFLELRTGRTKGLPFEDWFYKVFVERDPFFRYRDDYFKPCYDWLTIDDNLAVDFIGTVENINEDFTKLSDILQVDVTIDKKNSTQGERTYSQEMKEITLDLFKKDLENWYPHLIR